MRDRQNGVTQRISVSSSGTQSNGDSFDPLLAGGGRYVVFESEASNLVSGDTNAVTDIFVRDLVQGTTTRVSVSSSSVQGNGESQDPAVSSDGRYIAFESESTNFVSDTNARDDIFVRDTSNNTTKRVSVSSSGAQGDKTAQDPAISPDGRWVGFNSSSTNLVPGDTNNDTDIFVKDHIGGNIIRVSVSTSGTQGDTNTAQPPWLSSNANQAAFPSNATNLVSGDTNATWDIFVHDRTIPRTERASVSSSGAQANGASGIYDSISGDGRYVTYDSVATNLVSNDTNGASDIFVRDRTQGQTSRISVDSSGGQSNGASTRSVIAPGGRYVAFESSASNLVPNDTNGTTDIFIRDLTNGTTSRASLTSGNRPPVATLSVTPSQGDTSTSFRADLSGSYDPDGDALTYQIDWGDDTFTQAQSSDHRYSEPGTYQVIGTVTDDKGVAASDSEFITVCQAMASGSCVAEPQPTLSPISGACEESCGDTHASEDVRADAGLETPPCATDGVEGPRVQALYVYRTGNDSRYSLVGKTIRDRMAASSKHLDDSSRDFTQRIRFYCPGDVQAEVTEVAISSEKDADGSYKYSLCQGIQQTSYSATNRVYMVFPEMDTDTGPGAKSYTCGNAVANNTVGPAYAVVEFKCWMTPLSARCENGQKPASVLLHEFMHTLGSVSSQAPGGDDRPHPNGDSCKCHSIDRMDVMSNFHNHPDSYGNSPSQCLEKPGWWVDCMKNTYYDATPEKTEWLFTTGWNTARSHYLTNSSMVGGNGTLTPLFTAAYFNHPHPPVPSE